MKKILRIFVGFALIISGVGVLFVCILFALNSELIPSLLFSLPLGLFGAAAIFFGVEALRGRNLLEVLEDFFLSS